MADPGAYTLKVVAKDSEGELMDVGIAVRATVQSVDLTGAEALFNIGGNYVYQTDIVQLYEK